MPDPSRILVVAAHPDDEILGCGGTMTRLSREGHDVYIAILAEGMSSRSEHRAHGSERGFSQAMRPQFTPATASDCSKRQRTTPSSWRNCLTWAGQGHRIACCGTRPLPPGKRRGDRLRAKDQARVRSSRRQRRAVASFDISLIRQAQMQRGTSKRFRSGRAKA